MNICVIDIETLGTTQDSVVLSVGIVFNSGSTGEPATFASNLQIPAQIRKGRRIDPATACWWSKQLTEAWDASTFAPVQPRYALNELSMLIAAHEPEEIWARGSMDQYILEDLFRCFDLTIPWKYWQWRDERTLDRLGVEFGIMPLEKKHLAHSALGDARNSLANVEYLKKVLSMGLPAVDL